MFEMEDCSLEGGKQFARIAASDKRGHNEERGGAQKRRCMQQLCIANRRAVDEEALLSCSRVYDCTTPHISASLSTPVSTSSTHLATIKTFPPLIFCSGAAPRYVAGSHITNKSEFRIMLAFCLQRLYISFCHLTFI